MSYIGPDRRKAQRRQTCLAKRYHESPDRRVSEDRRQEGLSGVIAGLDANQMLRLRELFEQDDKAGRAWERHGDYDG